MDFIKMLFDTSFKRFIIIRLAGILLIITYVILTLIWVIMFLGWFSAGVANRNPGLVLLSLIGSPLGYTISIIFVRMWFELTIALIRLAETSTEIKELLEKK